MKRLVTKLALALLTLGGFGNVQGAAKTKVRTVPSNGYFIGAGILASAGLAIGYLGMRKAHKERAASEVQLAQTEEGRKLIRDKMTHRETMYKMWWDRNNDTIQTISFAGALLGILAGVGTLLHFSTK